MLARIVAFATILLMGVHTLALPVEETDAWGNPIGIELIPTEVHPEIITDEGVTLQYDDVSSVSPSLRVMRSADKAGLQTYTTAPYSAFTRRSGGES
jgi:hypothetical protein